ncbi:MAG: anthrone oxygenase family protein [Planctomycetota bacterium]
MGALDGLMIAAVLGSGLVAGIFFTFSNFVMPALGRLPKAHGIAAMQAINITVINPLAMIAMFGTGVVFITAAILGIRVGQGVIFWLYPVGAALYVVGCVGVTVAGNVPLNERLAKAEAQTREAADLWDHYLVRWTRFNSIRTAASALACAVYVVILVLG